MSEPIRLVVWDLDETFWRGTLTEGGITLREDTQQLVIALARRGILSSICSKNDFSAVKDILVKAGVWDYFVFPSIDWTPKGPRIAALIEAAQLRPATVLFLDDNPNNREEARHFVPELQVEGDAFIEQMAGHPLLQGKDDAHLERLKQYKLLEQRQAEQSAAGSDVTGFLRSSEIRVAIDFDVAAHLGRAVELINRTNQLNFTKSRLSEEPEAAKAALQELLGRYDIQAGLIRVVDRFGDHGYCGIYVLQNATLLHFAFSCRILGMGVETWLWRRLGRPQLKVVGEVLTDVRKDTREIDWIRLIPPGDASSATKSDAAATDAAPARRVGAPRIIAHGGCDLQILTHYFGVLDAEVIGEFNMNRGGLDARLDHSLFLRHAVDGLSDEAVASAGALGYRPQDFKTALLDASDAESVWLLSFWTDAAYAIYRHRTLDYHVPFAMIGNPDQRSDARRLDPENLEEVKRHPQRAFIGQMLAALKKDFEFEGAISQNFFQQNLEAILSRASPSTRVFILEANEYMTQPDGVRLVMTHTVRLNEWTQQVAARHANVVLVNIRDFVQNESEVQSPFHFDRMVYYRLFKGIEQDLIAPGALAAAAQPRLQAQAGVKARCLVQEGRHDEALKFAQAALAQSPQDPYLHGVAGEMLLRRGDWNGAEAQLREAVEIGNLAGHRKLLADVLTRQGRGEEAGAELKRLIESGLKDATLLSRLADLEASKGDLTAAEQHYRAALDLNKDFSAACNALSVVLERQGRRPEALKVTQDFVNQGTRDAHVYFRLGYLLMGTADLDGAEAALRRAIELEPTLTGAHHHLTEVLARKARQGQRASG